MFRIYLLIINLFIISLPGSAQLEDIKSEKKCYERYDKKGKLIPKEEYRYAEWQCGKVAGTIDCHGELSFEEGSNTVIRISNDNTNLMGVGKPYTGHCESCHMNGVREHRINFVNGKEDGVDTTWYPSGCIQVIREHILGAENGTWTYFYDSTYQEAWVYNYANGEKNGTHINYRLNGDTTKYETYANGLLNGPVRTYYTKMDSSRVKSVAYYKDGILNGPQRVYNPYGVLLEEIFMKDGQKDKECKYYYDDGEVLRIENWNVGIKNGEFKSFYLEQNVYTTENYVKGRKEGVWEEYYSTGILAKKWIYKKDQLLEEYHYDEHGRQTYPKISAAGDEDDEAPASKKKKKTPKPKKKKKEKNVEFE